MGSRKKKMQKQIEKSKEQAPDQQTTLSNLQSSKKLPVATTSKVKDRPNKLAFSKGQKVPDEKSLLSKSQWLVILCIAVAVAGVIFINKESRDAAGSVYKQYIHPQVLRTAELLSLDTTVYNQWIGDLKQGQNLNNDEFLDNDKSTTHPPSSFDSSANSFKIIGGAEIVQSEALTSENIVEAEIIHSEPPTNEKIDEAEIIQLEPLTTNENVEAKTVLSESLTDEKSDETKIVQSEPLANKNVDEAGIIQSETLTNEKIDETKFVQLEPLTIENIDNIKHSVAEETSEKNGAQKWSSDAITGQDTAKLPHTVSKESSGVSPQETDKSDSFTAHIELGQSQNTAEMPVVQGIKVKTTHKVTMDIMPEDSTVMKTENGIRSDTIEVHKKLPEKEETYTVDKEENDGISEDNTFGIKKDIIINNKDEMKLQTDQLLNSDNNNATEKEAFTTHNANIVSIQTEPPITKDYSASDNVIPFESGSEENIKQLKKTTGMPSPKPQENVQDSLQKNNNDLSAPSHLKDSESKDTINKQARVKYSKSAITNDADFKIRKKLDKAEEHLLNGKYEEALQKYDEILQKNPSSPRAHLGKADTLDKIAEQKRSNEFLEQSIAIYDLLLSLSDVPDELMKIGGRRLANRQQFRGWGIKSTKTLKFLVEKFPDDVELQREFGVSFLMVGQNKDAKKVFENILHLHPNDGFAKVHLGFILKTSDNNPSAGVKLLQEGIESNEPGTQDGRFYFHLGDGLQRLGQNVEARKIYQKGAKIGLFLSPDQRSLYNVDNLTARPWWTPEQTGYQKHLKLLQDNWIIIREEGLSQLNADTGTFLPEEENLREKGDWKQLTIFQQDIDNHMLEKKVDGWGLIKYRSKDGFIFSFGRKNQKVCAKVPKTCALIDQIDPAKNCRRGQVKFSVMHPGVHVWPHCGPTNCRIRAHLGLVVPEGPKIRVVNETRTWKEGDFIIFDDSFEHEVWHDGNSFRLVLIVDFWHPDLTESQRLSLTPI